MMRRYVLMYAGWLAGVLSMAAVAFVWYQHVERAGIAAFTERFRAHAMPGPEVPDVTDVPDGT